MAMNCQAGKNRSFESSIACWHYIQLVICGFRTMCHRSWTAVKEGQPSGGNDSGEMLNRNQGNTGTRSSPLSSLHHGPNWILPLSSIETAPIEVTNDFHVTTPVVSY